MSTTLSGNLKFDHYLVNQTEGAEVQLCDGNLKVPKNGWIGITASESSHTDVIYALRRRWIQIVDKEPSSPSAPEKVGPKVINSDAPSGKSIEQVKAEKNTVEKVVEPTGDTEKPGSVKSVKLGQSK